MRTIKFRGKAKIDGQWKYGDLHQKKGLYGLDCWIFEDDVTNITLVYPETVGQFTGLYDKNGKEIYEGDIVLIESVVFDNEYAVVEWEELSCRYIFRFANDDGYLSPLYCRDEITIIDNIHDNSGLLKGGEE